jgi:general L-amino acid transport system substrate-binding protein
MVLFRVWAVALFLCVLGASAANATTLDDVKARGFLKCGVSTSLAGFSATNAQGRWVGFDVDYCRALAVAIFNDPEKVRFTPTTNKERFTALQSREIDILARNTSWTYTRDVNLGFDFIGVNYYDGQGFMVPKSLNVKSVKDLDGARICVQTGTSTELNLADYFRSHGMKYEAVVVTTADEARQNYQAEACDAFTTDASGLAAVRAGLAKPADHIILPEIISKEPLGPAVRQGDNQWEDIARWTLDAMINAEELGVSSKNVDQMKASSKNPEIRRLLGVEDKLGEQMKLGNDWAYNIIKKVGNYGEVFDRNLGKTTPLGLNRGLNNLWSHGGILYAPPVR